MSTYEGAKKLFEDVIFERKMEEIKEGSKPTVRDRHKRPDKQLYVPRALRKTVSENISDGKNREIVSDWKNCEIVSDWKNSKNVSDGKNSENLSDGKYSENVSDGKNGENIVSKHKNEPSKRLSCAFKRTENNSFFPKEEGNVIKINKMCNSTLNDISDAEKNDMASFHMSNYTKTTNDLSVSSKEFADTLVKQQQSTKDDKPCFNDAKHIFNINVGNEPSELNHKMNAETFYKLKDNLQSTGTLKEEIFCNIKDAHCLDVTQEQDYTVKTNNCLENPEDSWEAKFNDEGDCLDPKLVKELCDITGHIELSVAKEDYSNYQPVSRSSTTEYDNIVELSGFPVEFNTQDLTSAFSTFQDSSYNIKWVDDCHALAIFCSPVIANQALHLSHPFIRVRPLSEGTKESKQKAKFCAHMFETHKPRPVTSAVLARRLVSGALGLKVNTSKEQRDKEKNILKQAKEKKKLKAKQKQDIWNGIVS